MCADTCKDAQRKAIMGRREALCKQFLLLCNINPADRPIRLDYLSEQGLKQSSLAFGPADSAHLPWAKEATARV